MLRPSISVALISALSVAGLAACSEGDGTEAMSSPATNADEDEDMDAEEEQEEEAEPEMEPEVEETGPEVLIDVVEAPFSTPDYEPDPGYDGEPADRLNENSLIEGTDDDGSPDAPALRMDIPFEDYDQFVELEWSVSRDLSGKVLTLPLKLEANDGDPECPKGLQFYVKTGPDYVWGEVGWTNLESVGIWNEIRFDLAQAEVPEDVADGYDPADVKAIGVKINTGDCGGDAVNREMKPAPATVLIDDITLSDAG